MITLPNRMPPEAEAGQVAYCGLCGRAGGPHIAL
jgi:hypothetical protein